MIINKRYIATKCKECKSAYAGYFYHVIKGCDWFHLCPNCFQLKKLDFHKENKVIVYDDNSIIYK